MGNGMGGVARVIFALVIEGPSQLVPSHTQSSIILISRYSVLTNGEKRPDPVVSRNRLNGSCDFSSSSRELIALAWTGEWNRPVKLNSFFITSVRGSNAFRAGTNAMLPV